MGRTLFASPTLGIGSPGSIFYSFIASTITVGKDGKKQIHFKVFSLACYYRMERMLHEPISNIQYSLLL